MQSSAHSRPRPSYRHLSDLLASSRNPSPQVHQPTHLFLKVEMSAVADSCVQAKPPLKSQSSFAGRWSKVLLENSPHFAARFFNDREGKTEKASSHRQPPIWTSGPVLIGHHHCPHHPLHHQDHRHHRHRHAILFRTGHPRPALSGFPTLGQLKRGGRQQSWIQQGVQQIQPCSQSGQSEINQRWIQQIQPFRSHIAMSVSAIWMVTSADVCVSRHPWSFTSGASLVSPGGVPSCV